MNSKLAGYVLAVTAAATYGMNPLFALPLYADGMDANSVLFFRYTLAIPIIGLMMLARGRRFRVKLTNIIPVVIMGLLMGLSSLTLFVSYNYMDAGIASTMLFVYPLMVALIMSAVYHERLSTLTMICLIVAMAGIGMLFAGGNGGSTVSLTGTMWVMLSSLSYAVYLVGVNRSGLRSMATLTLTFYSLVFGWFIFAGKAALSGSVILPVNPLMWFNIIGLALFPTAVSLLCTTSAIQRIGSTPTAILGVFEPVTALIFGVLIFGEVLTFNTIVGIVLIFVAVTMVIAGGNIQPILTRVRKMLPRRRR